MELLATDDKATIPQKDASRDLKRSCNLNLAAAHLKQKEYRLAAQAAGKVPSCPPLHTTTQGLDREEDHRL